VQIGLKLAYYYFAEDAKMRVACTSLGIRMELVWFVIWWKFGSSGVGTVLLGAGVGLDHWWYKI